MSETENNDQSQNDVGNGENDQRNSKNNNVSNNLMLKIINLLQNHQKYGNF